MRVAARDYEREKRKFRGGFAALARLHEDGVDVAFEMIDGDQRFVEAEAESLCVGNADQKRAGETRAFGDGDGVEIGEGDVGSRHGLADHRDDVAKMFAGREFRDNATIVRMERHLRGDDVRQRGGSGADDGRCGLVA